MGPTSNIASRTTPPSLALLGILLLAGSLLGASPASKEYGTGNSCAGDNGGIALPPGFCATVFADHIGHARHMAVAPDGVVYVNTWSGRYYANDTPPPGGFLVALQDSDGDGAADIAARFGDTVQKGSAGGTGIALYNGWLYAEMNDRILRYKLPDNGDRTERRAGDRRLRLAADRRSSHASLRHRQERQSFCRRGHGHEFLPAAKSHAERRRATSLAPSSRPEAASGATMPTRPASNSLPPAAMRPASAMPTASPSTRRGSAFTPPSMAATSFRRTGRNSIRRSREPIFRQRSCCAWKRAPTMAGPNAISTTLRTSWCLRRNMAATAARRSGSAPTRKAPIAAFPAHWAPNDLSLYAGSQFPARLSRRRVHRLSRLLEPRAVSARRLQCRVPAAQGRQGERQVRGLRRRIRRRGEGARQSRASSFRCRCRS